MSAGRLGFPEVSRPPRLLLPGLDVFLGYCGDTRLCSALPVGLPGVPLTRAPLSPWQGGR